ncbi:MAG: c-type cytochrome [Verrucomicrobiota bacterium]|nr:c-type cytochrome [Verrucomicrobiota bacterium]
MNVHSDTIVGMSAMPFISVSLLFSLCALFCVYGADPFAENVRTSEPLTPEAQQKTFHVPDGFEVQLVTSEPHIRKPMNMAFDSRGRLWVSESREYPYPAPLDKPGRDTIKIFEDFDANGRARKITTFAEGLNIPIGLYPYKNGVIAWSIPNIWFFQDTDGDGKADKKEILFGPLGWEKDTHGNNASFRRGFDGWLYATHGFNNTSTIKARDGSTITIHSGNTYRVRLDGSRVEQHTWGQVNPFGLCFDPYGNMYSADCHSSPIYELLRGGYYPSFGKPNDGLGYAPTMLQHTHGSTAIAGIIYYLDGYWPQEFQNNILIGNVMTSRINRDTISERGSTKVAHEQKDFLTTDDPWFRPVDIQMGPDGALYVADFYNRIIGHYEVPLEHPGRDRERGRIWRVIYKNKPAAPPFNLAAATLDQCLDELDSPFMTRRMLAMNEVTDRIGSTAIPSVKRLIGRSNPSSFQLIHGLWILHRLNAMENAYLSMAATHRDKAVRAHAMRIIGETATLTPFHTDLLKAGIKDADPLVQRCAAEASGLHPRQEFIPALLQLRQKTHPSDTHLLHATRIALRNQMAATDKVSFAASAAISENDSRALADVALAIPKPAAASFLLDHTQKYDEPDERLANCLKHIARHVEVDRLDDLAEVSRQKARNETDVQLTVFKSIQDGFSQRGLKVTPKIKDWGNELAGSLLSAATGRSTWINLPNPTKAFSANPWVLQERNAEDGATTLYITSLPSGGEQLTGILRSSSFPAPAAFSFYVVGHDGPPSEPALGNNSVRLIDSKTGQVLKQTPAPGNDIARKVTWDLREFAGRECHFELVDGDTGSGYAWIGAGRFDPPVIALPQSDPNKVNEKLLSALQITESLNLTNHQSALENLLTAGDHEFIVQASAAQALVSFSPSDEKRALAKLLQETALASNLRRTIVHSIATNGQSKTVLTQVFQMAPQRLQIKVAENLVASSEGVEVFLAMVERKEAPVGLLSARTIKERLATQSGPQLKQRIATLSDKLPPANEGIASKLEEKRIAFEKSQGNSNNGQALFVKNCAVCHQVDGAGALIGPQLDGIGNRGLERLIEDVLDPNRNVDHAFRSHLVILEDGDVISGLPRREEGELLVLADSTGKEISIQKKLIKERRESDSSLMPENFGDLLNPQELNDLLAFLLSRRGN